jgi:uncharacterized protein with von Willebrand factor type A (vWA) domain
MGIFDFLFGKKEELQEKKTESQSDDQQREVKYETKITSQQITKDQDKVRDIALKIIEEDPFKKEYDGKTDEDFTPFTNRIYQYQAITTVNVDVRRDYQKWLISIEGEVLGSLPETQRLEIEPHLEKDMLTAYVYVTGGPYKEYDKEIDGVRTGEVPFGLDIYLQFT